MGVCVCVCARTRARACVFNDEKVCGIHPTNMLCSDTCRASHGTTFLSSEELEQLYGCKRHWQHFETLIDSVNNIGGRCCLCTIVN